MSTGLTFGTISSQYGYQTGIIDKAQFSLLITVVIASAVIPTFIAQRWFQPGAEPDELERRVSPMPRPTADESGVSKPTEQEGA
jgi:hypothetical protein